MSQHEEARGRSAVMTVFVSFLLIFPIVLTLNAAEVERSAPVVTGTGRSPNQPSVLIGGDDTVDSQDVRAGDRRGPGGTAARFPDEMRSIDGADNNPFDPSRGSAGIPFLRLAPADYGDGRDEPAGRGRRSARMISNELSAQATDRPNAAGLSDMFWQWGQFLDHDIDLSRRWPILLESVRHRRCRLAILWFDPLSGAARVDHPARPLGYAMVVRPAACASSSTQITAYIDASNVYGSDSDRVPRLQLRSPRTRTSGRTAGHERRKRLLPFNDDGLPNAPTDAPMLLPGRGLPRQRAGRTDLACIRSSCASTTGWRSCKRFVRWVYDEMGGPKPPDEKLTGGERYEMARADRSRPRYRRSATTGVPPGACSVATALPDPTRGYDPVESNRRHRQHLLDRGVSLRS